jgi:hypothetical protein
MPNMTYFLIKFSALIGEGDIKVPKNNVTNDTITNILKLAFGVFAAIAVLMISIGALKMIMSKGNPQEVAKARETVIYAAVGLVISLSAFTIVSFVVGSV